MSAGETRRVNRGRGHAYLLDGAKVPGVTTILGNGLPKPALINWSANTTAEYAVDHWDELAEDKPSARLAKLKQARFADRDAAARRGTEVHGLAERLVQGEKVDVPDELAGHVEAYLRFLDEWDVEPVLVERSVFSRDFKYAGTFDLYAHLRGLGLCEIDLKTNRSGVFGETALQLAAYRYANFYLGDGFEEVALPEPDWTGVVHVRAEGYSLVPVEAGPEQFRIFRHVQWLTQHTENMRDFVGDELLPPAVREEVPA